MGRYSRSALAELLCAAITGTALAQGEMPRASLLTGEVGAIAKPVPSADRFVDLQYLKAAGVR
jgi:hypothetical protein